MLFAYVGPKTVMSRSTWVAWRYALGPIDWKRVAESVAASDLTFTAPSYQGEGSSGPEPDYERGVEFETHLLEIVASEGQSVSKWDDSSPWIWMFLRGVVDRQLEHLHDPA